MSPAPAMGSTGQLLRQAAEDGRIVFVLSGPAGAGKTTIARRAAAVVPGLCLNISCTTRSPRTKETSGGEYHFLPEAEFRMLVSQGEFLEWAEVHDHLYGTRASDVLDILSHAKDALLEIDVQGGAKVRSKYPRTVLIFLVAPSLLESRRRLVGRASESDAELESRLARATEELRESRHYDYLIVNDDLDLAVEELCCIVRAERARITERKRGTQLTESAGRSRSDEKDDYDGQR